MLTRLTLKLGVGQLRALLWTRHAPPAGNTRGPVTATSPSQRTERLSAFCSFICQPYRPLSVGSKFLSQQLTVLLTCATRGAGQREPSQLIPQPWRVTAIDIRCLAPHVPGIVLGQRYAERPLVQTSPPPCEEALSQTRTRAQRC